jgi:glycosyltransferase involved in cell wall biosynthesis
MRLTIVTPTLNRAHLLEPAIQSVLAQQWPDVEHLVVDGMSTDGTPELLAKYPHLRVIREPDSGLYDALNKGIRAATGEVIGHLNSDDEYLPGTFARVAAAFADPALDAVSGGAEILGENDAVRQRFLRPSEIALTFENVTVGGALIPNARFFRRTFYDRVGLYRPDLHVAADREFLFRAVLAQPKSVVVEQLFYRYRWHPESLTFSESPEKEARWRDEYLQLAEHYLDTAGLPPEAHAGARRWHLRESAQAATRALLSGHFSAARRYAARGLRRHATWPVMFLRHLGGALLPR